ncbi:minor capsid protein [Clostridium sp.]|uniref:phage tail terminator protein n=1 Tax=Clostridium sp. TaxID=1506 RepID=UPI0026231A51|nr:minor capsid protein [Clostridium sp.]
MTLDDISSWLQTVVKSPYYFSGKIDGSTDNCIGVEDATPVKPVLAIGGIQNTSYSIKCVAFFIHWGKNSMAAEIKAQEVFDAMFGNPNNAIIAGKRIIQFDMRFNEPVSLGLDPNGIYEYVIYTNIYYER